MKKPTDWGTRISLAIVVAASMALAWRLSPGSLGAAPPPPRPVVAAPSARAIHSEAASRSPLERIISGDAADAGGSTPGGTYRLSKPDRTWVLPPVLDGISDLATAPDSKSLWAVTDKLGTVYRVGIPDGAVAQTIEFGPTGDYEGIEQVDGKIIVARTDGMLFQINAEDGGTTQVETHLGPDCSVEGLSWDARRRRLLLVCKFPMPKLPKAHKSFAIYAMNLETQRLLAEPIIILPRQAIDDYLGTHASQPGLKAAMGDEFTPTAIAVHPGSGQIFLLSGRGTMLVVLGPTGALLRVEGLDADVHPHPKGLSFGADGTLYISDTSRGAHALIQRYPQSRD